MSKRVKRKRRRAKRKQRRESRRQRMTTTDVQPRGSSTEMRLIIEPSDAWLFRDGKPFRAGEDHWAVSMFPPTPLTMQGVIRSKVLLDSKTDLTEYTENPEGTDLYAVIGGKGRDYGSLNIRGPYLAHKEEDRWTRYYPTPLDLLSNAKNGAFSRLTVGDERIIANWPVENHLRPLYMPKEQDEAEPARGWIVADALHAYLAEGRLPQQNEVVSVEDIYALEPRVTIGLDRSVRRPRSQLLAEISMVRLSSDWALDVDVVGVEQWTSPGYLGIGGEARAAYYQVLHLDPSPEPPASLPSQFLLYFATPTWFEKGWLPADWGKWFAGGQVTLVAATLNRPDRIGGWDITLGEKQMRAYVPAGSLYYFESNGEITYNGKPITDDPADGQIGFGQVFIGKWSSI